MANTGSQIDSGQTVSIKLYKSELLYDVYNETNISGNAKFTGDNSQFIYYMKANGETQTVDKMLRCLYKSTEELKAFLLPYLASPSSGSDTSEERFNILGDVTGDDDFMEIKMNVSKRLNKSMLDSICQLAHRFIYLEMLVDWMRSVKPDECTGYMNEMSVISSSLRSCFFKLPPNRPTHSNT